MLYNSEKILILHPYIYLLLKPLFYCFLSITKIQLLVRNCFFHYLGVKTLVSDYLFINLYKNYEA